MDRFLLPRSFSMRLILGAFALILLTTFSAGIPAYWLARAQLERQAWSQVDGAQRATRSLLQAEQDRLFNLATLFAERPTLQQLARPRNLDDIFRAEPADEAAIAWTRIVAEAAGAAVTVLPLLPPIPALYTPNPGASLDARQLLGTCTPAAARLRQLTEQFADRHIPVVVRPGRGEPLW